MAADSPPEDQQEQAASKAAACDLVEELRSAPPAEDGDGNPLWDSSTTTPDASRVKKPSTSKRHPRCSQPPRSTKERPFAPRPSRAEVEQRIAEAQLWIAQRLPLIRIRENAARNWGVTNTKTVARYLGLARERMVEELISDRRRHQAEQIYALNECARRAMDAEQFSAAVGAFRVIAEIGGLLRAPIKPPEAKT
jgi:hypothetical protein